MQKNTIASEFNRMIKLAEKYKWISTGSDGVNGRISFKDMYSIFFVDIYVSKMTVVFKGSLSGQLSLKKQTDKELEYLFKSPSEFEMHHNTRKLR
jgi:hypothetical protein